MDGELTIQQARELVRDERRWPLVRRFLYGFAALIDDERVVAACGRHAVALREVPRVAAFVQERLAVRPLFHTFPKDDGSRLLLLPAETFRRLALWLAALADADRLKREIDGGKVRSFRAQLPGVYPEVFRIAPYFHKWRLPETGGTEFTLEGFRLLMTALKRLPGPLLDRQRLRFPVALEAGFFPLDGEVGLDLVYRLLELQFPEEHSLCCS
ncbi:MAG: hypothetical protein J6Z49_01410 [Kiritimatiellae bacterium]|nr:hypothetical protein [Kiritimatiellia bacterium]